MRNIKIRMERDKISPGQNIVTVMKMADTYGRYLSFFAFL